MHDINDIPNPEINNDFRRRCRYLVYKSSSCVFSVNKHLKIRRQNIKSSINNIILVFFYILNTILELSVLIGTLPRTIWPIKDTHNKYIKEKKYV